MTTISETLSQRVERVCGKKLDELATTEQLRGFAGARKALAAIGHGHDLSDEHIRNCERCRWEVQLGYSR